MSGKRTNRARNMAIAFPLLLLLGLAGVAFSLWQRAVLSAPLVAAVKEGNIVKVRSLLQRGADADAQEADSKPKSLREIFMQYFDRMRGKKRPEGQTVVQIAAEKKRFDLALLLMEKVANVRGTKGENALLYAVEAVGDRPGALIRGLLKGGAGLEARDESGRTPLLYTMQSRQFDLAHALVQNGAQVNVKSTDNSASPLLWAVNASNVDMVRLLLAKKASLSQAKDSSGTTALMVAALNCDVDMVRLLLESGADVNERSSDEKQTALMMAASRGQTEIVRLLLDHHADVRAVGSGGETALSCSMKEGEPALSSLLLKRGADVNARGKGTDASTALHQAVYWNRPELVRLLLKRGADAALKDGNGKTAEDLARDAGEPDILLLLRQSKHNL